MNKVIARHPRKDKVIFISSLVIFLYFITMLSLYYLKVSAVIVGVILELLTIPSFLLLIVLLVLAARSFIKDKFQLRSFAFYSIIVLLVTVAIIIIAS